MKCSDCGETVADTAKFCPNCGSKIKRPSVSVDQDAGTVKGAMTGGILGEGALDKGLDASIAQKVDTVEGSGAVVGAVVGGQEGNVHVGGEQRYGNTFEGENQEIHTGHEVGGDYISAGNISGSAVAIGRGASASYKQGLSGEEIAKLFAPLATAVQQAPPQNQQEAQQKLQELEAEAAKGDGADDSRMAGLIDELVKLVPGAVSAVTAAFASPILAGIAGPVTSFVLQRLQ